MRINRLLAIPLVCLLCLSLISAGAAAPIAASPPPPDPLAGLHAQVGSALRVGYHRQTGQVSFLAATSEHPLAAAAAATVSPEAAARAFLADYGPLFGLKDAQASLALMRVNEAGGRQYVRFRQQFAGVPVFGGEIIVQLDKASATVAAIGEAQPGLELDVNPGISAATATAAALNAASDWYRIKAANLQASAPALWIYDPALVEPWDGPTRLVWRLEVRARGAQPFDELILIDAESGSVALHFNQLDTALSLSTHTAGNGTSIPGTFICNQTDLACAAGDSHAKAAHKYAADTYNFYNTLFGRDSVNNAGLTLTSTVHYGVAYENAFWDGDDLQMVYGDGFAFPLGDDVVAHELTHGVTQFESGLFYYYESGAINEALSDIFGEFMDQTNNAGDDSPGVAWLMGEDIPVLGAIRNMANPPAFGDPDKITSSNYYTGTGDVPSPPHDNGGVHTNSGVANKAAYLMAAGGTFNSITVTVLGITKTAQIWYEAATDLITSGADYGDLYGALQQACTNLIGTATTAPDCAQVLNALDAVEMDQSPYPTYHPEAPLCPNGQSLATTLFFDGLEASGANWTVGATIGSNRWFRSTNYAHTGLYSLRATDFPAVAADSTVAMTGSVSLPAGAYLHFDHAFGFEQPAVDGGVVEYSTNGGGTWQDAGSLFDLTGQGYNGTLDVGAGPLDGRAGFVSDSHGYVSSRLGLGSLAGQSVRFRFRIGTDVGGTDTGWYVDDVRIYTCSGTPETIHRSYLPAVLNGVGGTPTAWTTITSEDFEGAFPGTGWVVSDDLAGSGEYFWGKRTCRPFAGSNSGWGPGAGADGSGLACGANYPNNVESWLVFGPFSLAGATAAELRFQLWAEQEDFFDYEFWGASTNGINFDGTTQDSSTGDVFLERVLDLNNVPTAGSLLGQANVWVAIVFITDESVIGGEGAFVDNIVLRKCEATCPALAVANPAAPARPAALVRP